MWRAAWSLLWGALPDRSFHGPFLGWHQEEPVFGEFCEGLVRPAAASPRATGLNLMFAQRC